MHDPWFKDILTLAKVLAEVWGDSSVTAASNLHKLDAYPQEPFSESITEMNDDSQAIRGSHKRLLRVFKKHANRYNASVGNPDDALDTLLISILHLKHRNGHHRTQMQECLRYWYQWKKAVVEGNSDPNPDVDSLFDEVSVILLSKLNARRREKKTRSLGEMIIRWLDSNSHESLQDIRQHLRQIIKKMKALKIVPPGADQLEEVDDVQSEAGSERTILPAEAENSRMSVSLEPWNSYAHIEYHVLILAN
jgi:hypothetical protein